MNIVDEFDDFLTKVAAIVETNRMLKEQNQQLKSELGNIINIKGNKLFMIKIT